MKKQYLILCLSVMLGWSSTAFSEELSTVDEEGDLFAVTEDLNAEAEKQKEISNRALSAFISSRIPASAAKNIENAEKVFCYTVTYAQADSKAYTINDMEITGSCGELSTEGRSLLRDAVLSNNSIFSTSVDNCNVNPRLLLRYIHGIDSTDILLSAPCYSITFFHGRDIISLNATPGKEIIEQLISTYSSLGEKFLSPALLGQMIPNGQVITQDQKEIVRKLKTNDTKKKWGNEPDNTAPQETSPAQPARKGWNKLK